VRLTESNEILEEIEKQSMTQRSIPMALLVAMRPRQWTKNLLLFAGFLFTLDSKSVQHSLIRASLGFVIFSLLSGATYIINDVVDVESDRQHPKKQFRPIASGELPIKIAIVMAIFITVVALTAASILGFRFEAAATAYALLTVAYSLWLKHVVIIDLLILASGFVLRAIAGAWAIPVGISVWLVLCTLLLALFLGIEKRQSQLIAVQNGRRGGRQILHEYSVEMLDQMSTIVTSALLMSYALYTIQSESAARHHYLIATIPFVLYGIFRYLYLVHRHGLGESPDEALLKDKPMLLNIFLWAVATALVVVLSH
jgi:4-hydroxybenzoate polyprenyltransferase